MNQAPEWIAVGRITRAHGVRGEVSVLPLSSVGDRFEPGAKLFVGESEDRPLTVAKCRLHRHRMLVGFAEVVGRESAEGLRGNYLFVPAGWAPDLPSGEYWTHQLIGCEVVTTDGRFLGRIAEVMATQANDVWAARSGDEEVLIPALKDVVKEVDVKARRVVVREIPGLTVPPS